MRTDFLTREFAPEDASAVDELWVRAFGGYEEDFPGSAEAVERGAVVLAQTGNRLVVAEVEFKGRVAGAARLWADDGVGWFDLLAASVTGAGKALVRRMERDAQDAGIRWLRTTCPDYRPLPDYFSRIGYQTVGRVNELLTLERRLPLLTVREQRRADAAAISALTGEDPWPFEQGHRPGWFVLADGERVAGRLRCPWRCLS